MKESGTTGGLLELLAGELVYRRHDGGNDGGKAKDKQTLQTGIAVSDEALNN